MAKVIQLSRNGELSRFCQRRAVHESGRGGRCPPPRDRPMTRTRSSRWPEASVPVLSGPHNSRPWAIGLRRLLRTAY